MMPWTDERRAILRAAWERGELATAIATKLGGVTRNDVIAQAHRMTPLPGGDLPRFAR